MPKKVTILHDKPAITTKAIGTDEPISEIHEGQDEDLVFVHRPPYRVVSRHYVDSQGRQVTEKFPEDGSLSGAVDLTDVPFGFLSKPETAEESKEPTHTEPPVNRGGRPQTRTPENLEELLCEFEAYEKQKGGGKQAVFARKKGLSAPTMSGLLKQARENRAANVR